MKTIPLRTVIDSGWYPVERDASGEFAHSKKYAGLHFPAGHNGLALDLYGSPRDLLKVKVEHKGQVVYSAPSGNTFTLRVPSGVGSCTLELEHEWVPKTVLGNTDKRRLGLCLRRVYADETLGPSQNDSSLHIDIALTDACNMNPPCVMCVDRNPTNTTRGLFMRQDILQKMKPFLIRARSVELQSNGEPLLFPGLIAMIRELSVHGVVVQFTTNGLLLTEEMSRQLIEAGLARIFVSLDAATPGTYGKIRRNADFEGLVRNLETLALMKRHLSTKNPQVLISMIVMKENIGEVPAFVELARKVQASVVFFRLLLPVKKNYEVNTERFRFNYFEQRIDPGTESFRGLMRSAYAKAKAYGIAVLSDNPEITRAVSYDESDPATRANTVQFTMAGDTSIVGYEKHYPKPKCMFPWERLLVYLNGDVRFCCLSKGALGNLDSQSIETIWNSRQARSIRQGLLDNNIPEECSSCYIVVPQQQLWKDILKEGI
ncbi:MAG: radical SAM/SPASM domain-containing protein [Candidatus Omnitrophica bacterium]|nr:radical SAM/SPASM domain-containing protein [Candidatus Omnitrophota bacterium]